MGGLQGGFRVGFGLTCLQVWEPANLFAFCILAGDFLIKIKTNSKGQQWKCHIIVELLPLATRGACPVGGGRWAWPAGMTVC